jgi:Methyltransferase domain
MYRRPRRCKTERFALSIPAIVSHTPALIRPQKTDTGMMAAALENLPIMLDLKYGPPDRQGSDPRLRRRFGYATPDDLYEALVYSLVDASTKWLDVGSGRSMFPANPALAELLAKRCSLLVGIDPSDNIRENPFLHEPHQCTLEGCAARHQFGLMTLRMVAEHITDPHGAVAALARLSAPRALVVIYTVSKWSPAAVLAALTPLAFHHKAKKFLWHTDESDTFPTEYRMNSRRALRDLFHFHGFREESFDRMDDCRSFARFYSLQLMELSTWKLLRTLGLRYPDSCILATYRKS